MEIETFNKMVVSLRSRLLRVAATLEGGDVEAEDFVQETFLRMWLCAINWTITLMSRLWH
uniref:sigma factor n=1 Tax=Prevotella aurantiaca TaxID=596085 RepID=UPI000ABF24F7|nr:sigma factor [Prevotella aurantiaca]